MPQDSNCFLQPQTSLFHARKDDVNAVYFHATKATDSLSIFRTWQCLNPSRCTFIEQHESGGSWYFLPNLRLFQFKVQFLCKTTSKSCFSFEAAHSCHCLHLPQFVLPFSDNISQHLWNYWDQNTNPMDANERNNKATTGKKAKQISFPW